MQDHTPAPLNIALAHAPENGVAHWCHTKDGTRIRLAHWTAANAKGTVLLCPGRTEYIEKYGHAVRDFQTLGYDVVVIDWRGQGLSDRLQANRMIGHVGKFSDFQHDLTEMVQYARDMGLANTLHLCAHSMAGCITLRGLMNGLPVKNVVYSAPMWGIHLEPHMRAAAWTVTALLGKSPIRGHLSPGAQSTSMVETGEFSSNLLTTDPQMYDYMVGQLKDNVDYELAGPSIGWLHGALREMRALSKMPSPDVPCLTFLGTDEKIVDSQRIKDRMAKWSNGTLEIVDTAKHEVIMESPPIRDRFFAAADAHFQSA